MMPKYPVTVESFGKGAGFRFGLINCGSSYIDAALMVYLGINSDHGSFNGANDLRIKAGIRNMGHLFPAERYLYKKLPDPAGRFVNSNGERGSTFSLSYKPFREATLLMGKEAAPKLLKATESISVVAEYGGKFDYSPHSVANFRSFLQKKYGTIAALNKRRRTTFTGFSVINPPKTPQEHLGLYHDFQEFCSEEFIASVCEKAEVVRAVCPDRPVTSQLSNLDFFAPKFIATRPVDFPTLIEKLYPAGCKDIFGWDSYCADDYMGAEIDFLRSICKSVPMINQETNVHTEDADVMARTYWLMVGKGLKGIYLFMLQAALYHDSYPKWGLHNYDLTPKEKMGAASDAIREAQRWEKLLVNGKAVSAGNEVFIYYSRMDLMQQQPLHSSWGEGVNSVYRVYELLRSNGFEVRFITPQQIARGELKKVKALVLTQATFINPEIVDIISKWIQSGGVAIADTKPGYYDDNGFISDRLMRLFGVAPAAAKGKKLSALALQESPQGYGEVTINALNVTDLPSSVLEIWQQYDSTHPMLKGIVPFTMSGYGRESIDYLSGEVVGMTFGGKPAIVCNTPGKGKTLYFACMLGSLYGGSATRFEANDTTAGLAPFKVVAGFLNYAGIKPYSSKNTLPRRLALRVRAEAPLVDANGNMMINLLSFNGFKLPDFKITIANPALTAGGKWYVFTDGSRKLTEVKAVYDAAGNAVEFSVPGFVNYAGLVQLKDYAPVISLESSYRQQIAAGETVTFKGKLFNTGKESLNGGKLSMQLPFGWQGRVSAPQVPTLAPGAAFEFTFTVTAPEKCAIERFRPLGVVFDNGKVTSAPAVMVVKFVGR